MEKPQLKLYWMYPDMLNLHGDRGNVLALLHVGDLLGIDIDVLRVERPAQAVDFSQADMLLFCSGEMRCMPVIVQALQQQRAGLDEFVARRGLVLALGNAGALLARHTARVRGEEDFAGLGLLDMQCHERDKVYGDDLWFRLNGGEEEQEIIGNQIQIIDSELAAGQAPLGRVIYGRGNQGQQDEGAQKDNIIFTNTLGPLLVKNPRLAQQLLHTMLHSKGLALPRRLTPQDTVFEDRSAELIKRFNEKKLAR